MLFVVCWCALCGACCALFVMWCHLLRYVLFVVCCSSLLSVCCLFVVVCSCLLLVVCGWLLLSLLRLLIANDCLCVCCVCCVVCVVCCFLFAASCSLLVLGCWCGSWFRCAVVVKCCVVMVVCCFWLLSVVACCC